MARTPRQPRLTYRDLNGDPSLGHIGPRIGAEEIQSVDHEHNVARRVGDTDNWEVSWWPGQRLTRELALRAVVMADSIATRHSWLESDPVRSVVERLGAELGLTVDEAIALAAAAVDTSEHTATGSWRRYAAPGRAARWHGLNSSPPSVSPSPGRRRWVARAVGAPGRLCK